MRNADLIKLELDVSFRTGTRLSYNTRRQDRYYTAPSTRMASTRKSYFLAPSWDLKPDEIALGSVIANFRAPQRVLSAATLTSSIDTLVPPSIEEKPCSGNAKQSRKWSTGLFATFIQVGALGGEVAYSSSSTIDIEYKCDSMETRRFTPSLGYVARASEDKDVKEYLKAEGFGAKAFMITGVKTAYNVTITTTEEREKEATAKVGVAIPTGKVTVGPKGSHKSTAIEKHTRTIAGPIVFAFQVEKICVSRKGKAISKEYVDGAMLGREDEDTSECIIELAGQGLNEDEIEDFDVATRSGTDDETGETCEIILP